jgi:hypothetical protein
MKVYNWLVCPFCNEVAERNVSGDVAGMESWLCNDTYCRKEFLIWEEDNWKEECDHSYEI